MRDDGVLALAAASGGSAENDEGAKLLAEAMQYVDSSQQSWPLEGRNPSHLKPPTTVVLVQLLLTGRSLVGSSCLGKAAALSFGDQERRVPGGWSLLLLLQMEALMRND